MKYPPPQKERNFSRRQRAEFLIFWQRLGNTFMLLL
jgi:hypothetical protein